MRVGILSYPMLFQRDGGLQIQVRETITALNRLRAVSPRLLEVELVNPNRNRLDDYDLIHVFSAINGNHRIVEAAVELGLPVVLSPLISPGWDRGAGLRASWASRLAGKLTAWNVQTSYAQTQGALHLAQRVIALGEAERDAIVSGFGIDPAAIRIIPNGINAHFFNTNPELFRRETSISGPFVLMVGSISPYKNQLGLVQALASVDLPIVMIGRPQRHDQEYLERLLKIPNVSWLGELDHEDPLLASAYSAAAVVALPSQGEVFPLTVLEALAAGTPVVMTAESALSLPDSGFALKKVRWDDARGQRDAVCALLRDPPPRAAVRALVTALTWERVAVQIANCYFELVDIESRHHVV